MKDVPWFAQVMGTRNKAKRKTKRSEKHANRVWRQVQEWRVCVHACKWVRASTINAAKGLQVAGAHGSGHGRRVGEGGVA